MRAREPRDMRPPLHCLSLLCVTAVFLAGSIFRHRLSADNVLVDRLQMNPISINSIDDHSLYTIGRGASEGMRPLEGEGGTIVSIAGLAIARVITKRGLSP